MNKAARIHDKTLCASHGGNQIIEGSLNVFFNRRSAARAGDTYVCATGDTGKILKGSLGITINGHPAARQNDELDHGGKIFEGSENITIGDSKNPVAIGGNGNPVYMGGNGKYVTIGTKLVQTNISPHLSNNDSQRLR